MIGFAQTDLVKLEILGDPKTLLPDTVALLEGGRIADIGDPHLVTQKYLAMQYGGEDEVAADLLRWRTLVRQ